MHFSPYAKQIFVASAPQLAALAVGSSSMLPAVLLSQLQSNNSPIHLDKGTASWIGAIHGIAGTLSVVMTALMQPMGRKFPFMLSCILVLIGWILIYFAEDATTIIVGESFHGLGSNIFHIVGLLAISELVSPELRSISMPILNVNLIVGMSATHIMGCFVHWKTISLIFSVPMVIAIAIGYFWPESPFWLANRGHYEKCEQVFTWLRGTDQESRQELTSLIRSEKENFQRNERKKKIEKSFRKGLILIVTRRSFYLPCLHMAVIISTFYCSGSTVIYILSSSIFERAANNKPAVLLAIMIVNSLSIVCASMSCFTIKYLKSKTVALSSITLAMVFLLLSSIVTFCQSRGLLSNDSFVYLICWAGHILSYYCGWLTIAFSLSAEIIPVQHRNFGGVLYIILSCILHSITVQVTPYLFEFLDLWGTFAIFLLSAVTGFVFIWKFVPETKGRTLHEIEDFYNVGYFHEEAIVTELASLNLSTAVNNLNKR